MRPRCTTTAIGLVLITLIFGTVTQGAAGARPSRSERVAQCTGRWELVDSPNPGGDFNVFRDVAALAPDDVWAVGSYVDGKEKALLAHWTGGGWELHDPGLDVDASIEAVAFASPTDGWAVGFTSIGFVVTALALHWDGAVWVQVEVPSIDNATSGPCGPLVRTPLAPF